MQSDQAIHADTIFNKVGLKKQRWVLVAFLLLHTVVAALHIQQQGLTTDERAYYIYSTRWLHGQVERIEKQDDSKTPVTVLSSIPRTIIQLIKPTYKASDNGLHDMRIGRYVMVAYTCVIAVYFFCWCRKLFGGWAWVLPLLLFLFDPMVLAYSMIIGSDMATGACVIAVFYHLFQLHHTRQKVNYWLAAIWIGVGCVAKPSLVFLLPCIAGMGLLLLLTGKISFRPWRLLAAGFIGVIVIMLVINTAYFFKQTGSQLTDMPTTSKLFKVIIGHIPFAGKLCMPVPKTYYASLDLLQYHKEIGGGTTKSSYPGVYLNGRYKLKSGFWYYYLVVACYKMPIATLLLLILSIVTGIIFFDWRRFFSEQCWYVWPAVFFVLVLSLFNSFQIGFRHMLVIYPLLFIVIAAMLNRIQQRVPLAASAAWVLFLWMVLSVAHYFPNLIPYTNEMVWNKKMVYKKMNDSNIDYSQSLPDMAEYIAANPGLTEAPKKPAGGRFVVSIQQLNPYNIDTATTRAWLQNFKPVSHYQYSLLVYEVGGKPLKSKK